MTTLVVAVIKPHMLESVRSALLGAGVVGMTVTEIQGYGRQGGHSETFRGAEYQVDFKPKVKIEVLALDDEADAVTKLLADSARTGKIGDGKIWTIPVGSVIRIRTGERDHEAI